MGSSKTTQNTKASECNPFGVHVQFVNTESYPVLPCIAPCSGRHSWKWVYVWRDGGRREERQETREGKGDGIRMKGNSDFRKSLSKIKLVKL